MAFIALCTNALIYWSWNEFLFQGDFRNTPITLGSANTPQPHLQQQHQQQQQQQQNESIFEDVVEEMTPTEAEHLLSDKLIEKRSVEFPHHVISQAQIDLTKGFHFKRIWASTS